MIPRLATRTDRALVTPPLRTAKVYSRTQINSVALAARKVIDAEERAKAAVHEGTVENREYDLAFDDYMALLKSYGCAWLALDILTRFEAPPPKREPSFARILLLTAIVLAIGFMALAWFAGDVESGTELGVWVGGGR